MSEREPNIKIPVDLTNPGQFFACCGLLELAGRLWPGAEGWFESGQFSIVGPTECSLPALFVKIADSTVENTMSPAQNAKLEELPSLIKEKREATSLLEDKKKELESLSSEEVTTAQNAILQELPALIKEHRRVTLMFEDEKKELDSLRRELPIVLAGSTEIRVDWFCDDIAGGSRFKTWAGQQSVLAITTAMHSAINVLRSNSGDSIWQNVRRIGLPFNFDSDLGGQGSALDIGFSFDPLAGSEATRIEGTCRPWLELLAFIGLQRFRPMEIKGQNRFLFAAWHIPLEPSVAAACACRCIETGGESIYEFPLLYRTKYLKSFLPAIPFQGDEDE